MSSRQNLITDIDRVFESDSGYVLDFSDRTFGQFFIEQLGIDIDAREHHAGGSSKGNRLRHFLRNTDARTAARTLRALLAYRTDYLALREIDDPQPRALTKVQALIERLEQGKASTDGIDRFSADATLDELVDSIERDIRADKHQVTLDRLQTYCMKRFAYLLRLKELEPVASESLNARAGRYFNPLRRSGQRAVTDKIMKTTVEVFELFSDVRNNASLAHDNELVNAAEARFFFDGVTNLLRFVRSIEGAAFDQPDRARPASE